MLDKNCPLFNSLSEPELSTLSSVSKVRVLNKNEYLCAQNKCREHFFTIVSGSATIERIFANGHRQIVAFLFPGEMAGLYNSESFEYGVKSLAPLTVNQFQNDELIELSEKIPRLRENLKDVREKVSNMIFNQLYLLGQKKAHERVCYLLAQLLERMPDASPSLLDLPMTRLDIADHLGLTVETVSRSMTKLKQDGLIDIAGPHSVSINDLKAVQQLGGIE